MNIEYIMIYQTCYIIIKIIKKKKYLISMIRKKHLIGYPILLHSQILSFVLNKIIY